MLDSAQDEIPSRVSITFHELSQTMESYDSKQFSNIREILIAISSIEQAVHMKKEKTFY